MCEFKNKVVMITGGTSGIGKGIADYFYQQGSIISTCSIDTKKITTMKNEYPKDKLHIEYVDVSNEEKVKQFVENTFNKFGRIDILVNNAGIYPQCMLKDMSTDLWDKTFSINLKSIFILTKLVFEIMKEQKEGGVVINAGSFAGVVPSVGAGAYSATKSGVLSLTKTFAAELAPYNIRVNAYVPGIIETQMTKKVLATQGENKRKQLPLRRFGKPKDVAETVAFLASERSSYITGTMIEITGGKLCVQNPDLAYERSNYESNTKRNI